MMKYRVEVFYWVEGSGFTHSEIVDNTNDLLNEKDLEESYSDYLEDYDGGEIKLRDNDTNEVVSFWKGC